MRDIEWNELTRSPGKLFKCPQQNYFPFSTFSTCLYDIYVMFVLHLCHVCFIFVSHFHEFHLQERFCLPPQCGPNINAIVEVNVPINFFPQQSHLSSKFCTFFSSLNLVFSSLSIVFYSLIHIYVPSHGSKNIHKRRAKSISWNIWQTKFVGKISW